MPMFAFLLPVFIMVCGMAINISYLRLARTELKIASDATAHAAGRAMSLYQTTDDAIATAVAMAPLNSVVGQPFSIDASWVKFGQSNRDGSGFGRYVFQERDKVQIDNGIHKVNSVAIDGALDVEILIRALPQYSSFDVATNSIATQVDRDIALVLDRSGSMIWYKNKDDWEYVFNDLRSRGRINNSDRNRARNGWDLTHYVSPFSTYPNNNYDNFPNGNSNSNYFISNTVWSRLTADRFRNDRYLSVYEFIYDLAYVSNTRAPRHSRWAELERGVDAFLDILDTTDQEELVSLCSFSGDSRLDYSLSLEYPPIRSFVATEYPVGATAIGKGIQTAIPSIMTAANARPFAAKTIVILTDGENNASPDPVSVVTEMVGQYNITVHTVTFTPNADQDTMRDVAAVGGGRHYHADDGNSLVAIFEEIANNLPTILTE